MNLAPVERALSRAVEEGVFPGAVLLIARDGEVLLEQGVGTCWLSPGGRQNTAPSESPRQASAARGAETRGDSNAVTVDTRYDLSSLTKVLATAPLLFGLVDDGHLSLDDFVESWLPEFADGPLPVRSRAERGARASVRLRHLLAHSAGLPAHRAYFREVPSSLASSGQDSFTSVEARRDWLVDRVLREPLEAVPGARAVYSDLGFILLGEILTRALGRRLDAIFADRVARPLGLTSLGFLPVAEGRAEVGAGWNAGAAAIAPTETCPWRGRTIHAEVHDENAWAMGGVAGHAGLFGTARDVHSIACALERADAGERRGILSPTAVRELWRRDASVDGSTRTLGWDTPSPEGSSSGRFMSKRTVGHLGFTGTSLWIDRTRGVHVILLSNRVHPSRENQAIRAFRPVIHDLVIEALG